MALIHCPECNSNISDKAKMCPHCGYELPKKEPMFQGVYCPKCLNSSLKLEGRDNICPFCKIQEKESIYGTFHEIYHYDETHPELKQSSEFCEEAYQYRINYVPGDYKTSNSVKCPTCQSTNIRKISGLESGASIAMFGLFSKKINKTFKCNGCGYTW